MKKEADIEMILSNIAIRPNETAKNAAYERMMARRAELLTAESNGRRKTLSEDDLEGIAAAGLPPEDTKNIVIDYEEDESNAKGQK